LSIKVEIERRADKDDAAKACQHRPGKPSKRHRAPFVVIGAALAHFDRLLPSEVDHGARRCGAVLR
jgi:hypothetical protein